ncbi:fatty acid hydroxylase superfamily-domain-containing protein [Syncephalis plumigaleata]|nr:fatty acid hydroxylase superfamily-domain-containing protein [Syncephalis plumigaleata]
MTCNASIGSACVDLNIDSNADQRLFTAEGLPYTPNFLEQLWIKMFEGRDPAIVLGVFIFTLMEIIHFGGVLLYAILGKFSFMKKYRTQEKTMSSAEQWKCLRTVLFNQLVITLPSAFLFHGSAVQFGVKIVDAFPTWQIFLFQLVVFCVYGDFYHYWAHRLLHVSWMYRHFHKTHHEYSTPAGIVAEYTHPVEALIYSIGITLGPFLWATYVSEVHAITVITWVAIFILHSTETHTCYEMPWSLSRIFPFFAATEYHDYHHLSFNNNFSNMFTWWDRIFGTDGRYQAYHEKRRAIKAEAATLRRKNN